MHPQATEFIMSLVEFHADLTRLNALLERLCEAVEFAAGIKPAIPPGPKKQAGLEDVSRITNTGRWLAEMEAEMEKKNPFRGGKETA